MYVFSVALWAALHPLYSLLYDSGHVSVIQTFSKTDLFAGKRIGISLSNTMWNILRNKLLTFPHLMALFCKIFSNIGLKKSN